VDVWRECPLSFESWFAGAAHLWPGCATLTRRLCLAVDLVEDAKLITEYESFHAAGAVWPEVSAEIRSRGFIDMEIWRTGNRCVMIAEVVDDFPRPVPLTLAASATRWEALMSRFQRPLAQAPDGEKWTRMARIFALSEQAAGSTDA